MDCTRCRAELSGLLDGELPPTIERSARAHLRACPACREDMEQLRAAVTLVRSVPAIAPPAGLEERILGALDPSGPTPSMPVSRRAPAGRAGIGGWLLRRGGPAAAVLVGIFLVGFTLGERSTARVETLEMARIRERLEAAHAGLQDLEDEMSLRRREWTVERDELVRGVTAARTEIAAISKAHDEELRAERARRFELESRFRDLAERELERERALEHLASEPGAERAGADPPAPPPPEISRDSGSEVVSPGSPPAAVGEPEAAPESGRERRAAVTFLRRGGEYEVVLRGPRHEIVPRLLEVARDDGDPELADIALGALEHVLRNDLRASGDPQEALLDPPGGGFLSRLGRGLERATGSLEARAIDEPAPPGGPVEVRARRLRILEEAWIRSAGKLDVEDDSPDRDARGVRPRKGR